MGVSIIRHIAWADAAGASMVPLIVRDGLQLTYDARATVLSLSDPHVAGVASATRSSQNPDSPLDQETLRKKGLLKGRTRGDD
jgi:hypothetical protein